LVPAAGRGEGWRWRKRKCTKTKTIDAALKRFKRSIAKDGVLAEIRKREHYVKPSVRRKKKSEAARKKRRP